VRPAETRSLPSFTRSIRVHITELDPIPVAQVLAEGGPAAGGKAAFDLLESRMPTLRGRKMYGVFYEEEGEESYYACVKLDDEHPDAMGFERGLIPGGRYARRATAPGQPCS
jgi:DNA gyrase inhibitor GyrI